MLAEGLNVETTTRGNFLTHSPLLISTFPRPPTPDELCGLYVHIPFCETKCGYCDFFSIPLKGRHTGPLVDQVCRELQQRLGRNGRRVDTIFLGGGTPTILPTHELARLLGVISELVPVAQLAEFTVEANPATVDQEKAELLVRSGVTRVSMGAQSFFAKELAALERLHSPADIAPSVATLRRAGPIQLNLDLMFGIPGQTLDTWTQSLRRAIDLGVDHIACYGLTYESGTRLTAQKQRGLIAPCDEQLEAELYLHAIDTLEAAGYRQYEISNFAKPGCASKHNLVYWRNGPYIGVGPSAAGCLGQRRYKNVADVSGYIRRIAERGDAEMESETIDTQMLMMEMVMMQLRLNEGLSLVAFRQRTGADPLACGRQDTCGGQDACDEQPNLFRDVVCRFEDQGLVSVSETHIRLTRTGRLVANPIISELASACSTIVG